MPEMTNEQINREIAGKVMWWHFHGMHIRDAKGAVVMVATSWIPVFEIEQAFQVVEKMRELGFDFHLHFEAAIGWKSDVTFDKGDIRGRSRDDRASRAICLAALKALEVKG